MLRELCFLTLVLSFLCSCYGLLTALLCSFTKQRALLLASRVASLYSSFLILISGFFLILAFYSRDYSILYVYKNSSNDLPVFYRISAFWSSLEGSHLLWTTLLSFFVSIALWTNNKKNESLMPIISFAGQSILGWMLFLACTSSNPFVALFPKPTNGMGMNELLQNPYMMIHPPILFTGYTTLIIPFLYSLASLWKSELYESCLITMRRWSIISWTFLTVGIFLGGRWAYVELGWAGYWAWDPVENSSFLPWLFLTAFIHALILVKDTGKHKSLLFALGFLSAFFSYFGTFITRSGIISSVHSFAQSDVAMSYLVFLVAFLVITLLIYALRGQKHIRANFSRLPKIHHQQLFLLAQMLFASFAIIILMGTLYPIISEYITGIRFNVQAPYFNSFAPYIGFLFIILITLGNLMRREKKYRFLKRNHFIIAVIIASSLTFLFCFQGQVFATGNSYGLILQLIGLELCFLSATLLSFDLWQQLRKSSQGKLRPLGSFFSHIGVLVAIIGFLGNYRGLSELKTLQHLEDFNFYHYNFRFEGLQIAQEENVIFYKAPITITKDQKPWGIIFPARAKYPTKNELIHEIDYSSNFWHDIYITLVDFDQKTGMWATFDFHINPSVRLVWISLIFFVLGGILSLSSSFRKPRRGV